MRIIKVKRAPNRKPRTRKEDKKKYLAEVGSYTLEDCKHNPNDPAPERYRKKVLRDKLKRDLKSEMIKNPTEAESLLGKAICSKKRRFRFIRQSIRHGYILDFYNQELKLAVEVDGEYHQRRIAYDNRRDSILAGKGILVVRFTNEQVLTDVSSVKSIITSVIDRRKKELGTKTSPAWKGYLNKTKEK